MFYVFAAMPAAMLLIHEAIPQIRLLRSAAYHHIRHLEGSYIYSSFALYFCLLSFFSSLSSLFFLFLSASSSFFFLLISFLSSYLTSSSSLLPLPLFFLFSLHPPKIFPFLVPSSSSLFPFPPVPYPFLYYYFFLFSLLLSLYFLFLFSVLLALRGVCYNCPCYYLGLFPHLYVYYIDGSQNIHSVFIPLDFAIGARIERKRMNRSFRSLSD